MIWMTRDLLKGRPDDIWATVRGRGDPQCVKTKGTEIGGRDEFGRGG